MIPYTCIFGDSLSQLKSIPDASADLIFADPPYWMRVTGRLQRVEGTDFDGCDDAWDNQFQRQDQYVQFTTQWLSECRRVLKDTGSIWVIGSMQCIYTIGGVMQDLGYWFVNDVIWHKTNPTPNFRGTRLNNSHETLIWATKSEESKFTFHYKTAKELNRDALNEDDWATGLRKQMGSVWRFPVCQGRERLKNDAGLKLHSTQKPEALLHRIITISSNIGDTVLDPFGGTMTTGAVAIQLGRKPIIIEQEAEYFNAGQARLAKTLPYHDAFALAAFDQKPPRVGIKTLIKSGTLLVGEKLWFKKSPHQEPTLEATLNENGRLNIANKEFDIHRGAGFAQNKNTRLNGWSFWHAERDDQLMPIDALRKAHRKEHMGFCSIEELEINVKRNPIDQDDVQSHCQEKRGFPNALQQVISHYFPRLLQHAGLALLSTESGQQQHNLVQHQDGRYRHIVLVNDSVDDADFRHELKKVQNQWRRRFNPTEAQVCLIAFDPRTNDLSSHPSKSIDDFFKSIGCAYLWQTVQNWIQAYLDIPTGYDH